MWCSNVRLLLDMTVQSGARLDYLHRAGCADRSCPLLSCPPNERPSSSFLRFPILMSQGIVNFAALGSFTFRPQ